MNRPSDVCNDSARCRRPRDVTSNLDRVNKSFRQMHADSFVTGYGW